MDAPERARDATRWQQAQRFAASGLLVTATHILVADGLIRLVLPVPPLANGLAFVVATAFSYTINTLWSFSRPLHRRTLFRFVLVSCVGLGLAVGVSGIAHYLQFHYMYGIALVVATVPPVTFLLHSVWTYR